MIQVSYIISNINKAYAFEWIADKLPSTDLKLSFILLNPDDSFLESHLIDKGIQCDRIRYNGFKDFSGTLIKVAQLLRSTKPDAIHCHLFHATLIGLLAGWLLGIKKRIHTRHHSTYNWEYNKKGGWIDRVINRLSTDIVAISKNVFNVLVEREHVNSSKIHLVHHGFKLSLFKSASHVRKTNLTNKYNPRKKRPIIGVIARWIEWKGIQYIIPAFKKILKDYPDAFLVLANANGPYKPEINKLLSELPQGSYTTIPFENEHFALYQLFDVYVHTPINATIEAFGQTYVEALAAGVPSIFTMSGVAHEFIEHEKNALVVPYKDSVAICNSIKKLLANKNLNSEIIENGFSSLSSFNLDQMLNKLEVLYSK